MKVRAQSGHALVSVLIVLAALTPLGAFAVMQARLDALVQHHVGRAAAAFAAAESGLAHARAEMRLDPSFDRLAHGPDRQPDTSDDATFPYLGTAAVPIDPEYRYDLRVDQVSETRIDVISTATGREGSKHVLGLTVVRERALLPAALATAATQVTFDPGTGFRLNGSDQAGRDPALPGLGVAADDTAALLRATVATDAGLRIAGAGATPSIQAAPVVSIDEIAAKLTARRTLDVGPHLAAAIGSGVAVSGGSLDVDWSSGDGVLIVGGNLRVSGELVFSGLVIVLGDVLFESESIVRIEGGLLQGRGHRVLALLGQGAVNYDSAAIERIDAAFPGLLPHRSRVVGWRDLS